VAQGTLPRPRRDQWLGCSDVSGPEVITCDNTTFLYTRKDADRMGVLFSIPFYGSDGKLKGSVAGIIRSNAPRQLLPKHNFALINAGYHYVSRASDDGQEGASADWVRQGKPDSNLIYSEVLPVTLTDPQSQWAVWVGYPNSAFYNSDQARSIKSIECASYAVVAIRGVGCC